MRNKSKEQISLKGNTIRCKKLATIVSGRKNVARSFVRRKQVSTSAEMLQQRTFTFTLQLHFGTRAYLFSLDEGSCYSFSARNNCCEFLASYGIIFKKIFNYNVRRVTLAAITMTFYYNKYVFAVKI